MALQDVNWYVDVDFANDHLGRDSAEWRIQCSLNAFRALHAAKNLCCLCTPKVADGASLGAGWLRREPA